MTAFSEATFMSTRVVTATCVAAVRYLPRGMTPYITDTLLLAALPIQWKLGGSPRCLHDGPEAAPA